MQLQCVIRTPYASYVQRPDAFSMHPTTETPLTPSRSCEVTILSKSFIGGNVTTDHLAQLVLLGKLAAQDIEIGHQAPAAVEQGLLGGDLAIGLDAKLKGSKEGVGN